MKILLVTKQVLWVKDGLVYSPFALSSTLCRFSMMGELYVCCYEFKGKASQPVDTVTDIPVQNVAFLDNESSLKKRYLDRKHNQQTIERFAKDVDLVIGYIPSTVGDLALDVAHKIGKKYMAFLVACIWDGMWNHHSWKARAMAPIFLKETRRTVREADFVWYVTEKFLQDRYPTKGFSLGYTDTNIDPLDNDVLNERLERIDNNDGKIRLLTVGHLDVGFKGQQFVVAAIPEILKKGVDVEYYMIGDGDPDRLISLAKKHGVADRVFALGRMPRNEVLDWMDRADVYIQPSLQEGLPRSIAEAMSRAMPVIGSRTGGIPEMIEGQWITERKSISSIVDKVTFLDLENMRKQAIRNFDFAKRYQPDVVDMRLESFFNDIKARL